MHHTYSSVHCEENTLEAVCHSQSQTAKQVHRSKLQRQLLLTNATDEPGADWTHLHRAMQEATEAARSSTMRHVNNRWISEASIRLIGEQKTIPPGGQFRNVLNTLKRRITMSLRSDRDCWWVARARKMQKMNVSETIVESDDRLTNSVAPAGTLDRAF